MACTEHPQKAYNETYPLSMPTVTDEGTQYKIALIADMDQESKSDKEANTWNSIFKLGIVTVRKDGTVSVEWKEETQLSTHVSEKGRGAELSELVVFNGRLYTVDDRTGTVFEIVDGKDIVPWVTLKDGDGQVKKGFKGEWMTVKDKKLYVGSIGKVWTTPTGEFVNENPQYIKIITPEGQVTSIQWRDNYNHMAEAAGIQEPGYMIHEAGCWSNIHKQWYFLPRKASKLRYNDVEDEHRSANILVTGDEDFQNLKVAQMGPLNLNRGFSTFKFIPGTQDTIILALKTEEIENQTATYIVAYDIQGNTRMCEQFISPTKFEGLEFI